MGVLQLGRRMAVSTLAGLFVTPAGVAFRCGGLGGAERTSQVDFLPYLKSGSSLMVRAGDPFSPLRPE